MRKTKFDRIKRNKQIHNYSGRFQYISFNSWLSRQKKNQQAEVIG